VAEVSLQLQQEGIVFVCGDVSHMAPEVGRAFIDLFIARTGAAVPDRLIKLFVAGGQSVARF
jgi:sulfite reductase alpha subunit-like flavoprotein